MDTEKAPSLNKLYKLQEPQTSTGLIWEYSNYSPEIALLVLLNKLHRIHRTRRAKGYFGSIYKFPYFHWEL